MNKAGTRRQFMQALAACLAMPVTTLAANVPPAEQATLIDQFIAAGSALLGISLEDRDLALPYIVLMRKQFSEAQLQAFVAANAPGKSTSAPNSKTGPIERQAMLLWLTGLSAESAANAVTVVTYARAAVWQAMSFAKPPGWCGGEFGYWADPPAPR